MGGVPVKVCGPSNGGPLPLQFGLKLKGETKGTQFWGGTYSTVTVRVSRRPKHHFPPQWRVVAAGAGHTNSNLAIPRCSGSDWSWYSFFALNPLCLKKRHLETHFCHPTTPGLALMNSWRQPAKVCRRDNPRKVLASETPQPCIYLRGHGVRSQLPFRLQTCNPPNVDLGYTKGCSASLGRSCWKTPVRFRGNLWRGQVVSRIVKVESSWPL